MESSLASETNSSVPMAVSTFPIQRLPDEILSRVIDVGSWADQSDELDFYRQGWTDDMKPRPKDFVRIALQVCCQWREIALWQGHPHRWQMCLMFRSDGYATSPGTYFSREFSRFRRGLRASDGCDLLVGIHSWTRTNFDVDFESGDSTEAVNVQLFMHGIKLLQPYLSQILMLGVDISHSDPLHLLFSMLQRWPSSSRLTSLSISCAGTEAMRAHNIGSSSQLSECHLLNFQRCSSDGDEEVLQSLPPTLAHVDLKHVSLPPSFTLPYGLTQLSITDKPGNVNNIHTLPVIPDLSHLTFLHLDLRNTDAPSTEFRIDGVLTLRLDIDLKSLLAWSQVIHAESLQHLDLTVAEATFDESPPIVDLSIPSDNDEWEPLLAAARLDLTCSVNALRGILSLLAINGIVAMSIMFMHKDLFCWEMNEYLESLFRSRSIEYEEIIFPLLQTLWIVENGEKWSQTLEYASFPKLETLSCTRSDLSRTNDPEEALDFTEWLSFSSTHESNSFNNLRTLTLWLPSFEAGHPHPLEYTANIVELQVDVSRPRPKDWDVWMIYPGRRPPSPHPLPLTSLRFFSVNLYIKHDATLEDTLEAKMNEIQASRVQHGVALERVCIKWWMQTTEYRQNIRTGFLERVPAPSSED